MTKLNNIFPNGAPYEPDVLCSVSVILSQHRSSSVSAPQLENIPWWGKNNLRVGEGGKRAFRRRANIY